MLKYVLIFFFLLPLIAFSQQKIPKKSNAIEIEGLTFKEVANALLDAGYNFDKIDSNFQTIKTEFKVGKDVNKWMKIRLYVRVKDSIAIISGEWYNTMFVGNKFLGQEKTIENSTSKIEYTFGNPKNCFLEMDEFAKSFNKNSTYLIQ